MSDIAINDQKIQVEETASGAAISEGTAQRMGGNDNLFLETPDFYLGFFVDGVHRVRQALDGIQVFPDKCRLIDIKISNFVPGASGTTTFDVHWYADGGSVDQGSIFSTLPTAGTTVPAGGGFVRNFDIADTQGDTTGFNAASIAFSKTSFVRGDRLRFDMDTIMTGACTLDFRLGFKKEP